jgi:excisionase family DNA binding protein
MEMMDRLLTVSEAARMLALRPGTIRVWCYRGLLAYVKVGTRAVRIPVSEIRRIVRAPIR